ncbi:protein phosphatase 2C [Dictyocaulus viviparus]|uniref:Protein phosphatase 2C n=1 Tax=Dictyocaulus viviparus TaxID=29172 RepID=A0A0D8XWQ1_DICVI|nr:protein phosphatase 2C [Dictyocaulus viviparus]
MSPPVNAEKSYLRLGVRFGENLRVSVAANQGGRKYMEDRVHIETIRKEDGSIKFTFFGIFDGHGGHEASEYVRRNLLENIMKCELFESDDDDDILEAIRLGFLTTHHGIWKVVSEWPRTASGYTSTAGTTASVAILRNGKLYTGHVGDSAIVLLKRSYRTDNLEDLVPHRLTVDHKPESEDEQARIRVAGGSVALKSGVARVVWTRPLKHHAGPIRRSTPTESIPFLAVARSLGDVWSYCEDTKEFIVSPEPDLAVEELTGKIVEEKIGDDVCIVLASDGLTNVLGPIQVAAVIDEEESVTQIGISKSEDLVYRNKHTNLARVLVANAFRNWRHLRADNVTAIAVMLDSPFADLPVDHPCVEEYIGINESIDRVFIDDPECVVRISPSATLKLFTYRTPILYKGARDPNFSVVDYNGPGFITHNDECLIEEHYRATCGGAEYDGVMKEIGLDSIATLTSNMNTNIICSRVNTSDYHVKGIQRSSPVVIKNEEELASTKNGEDAYFGRTSPKTSSKHSIIEEDETDEEEIQVLPVTSSKRSAKFIHSGEDVIAVRKRVTRSVSKFLEESEASSRPIKVVAKRSSTMTRKEPCRSACVNVEDQVLTPSGSVDIKIHVDGSLTPTFGMITSYLSDISK